MHVAIIGHTGVVGEEIKTLLDKRNFPYTKLSLFNRKNSPMRADWQSIDLAFFAAGKEISTQYIPLAIKNNCRVIDSSSAYRKTYPLIIPEINGHMISTSPLICSPNCTATLLLLALYPLHQHTKIKRIIAATYQAASGGGKKMMDLLLNTPEKFDLHLHDSFESDSSYCGEEEKMIFETRKILCAPNLKMSARCVRVPVLRAHSIFANVEFTSEIKDPIKLLENAPGIKLTHRPTPKLASHQEDVLVGGIRKDQSNSNALELWIVGDQLLKGAALNAVQIAELMLKNTQISEKTVKFQVPL